MYLQQGTQWFRISLLLIYLGDILTLFWFPGLSKRFSIDIFINCGVDIGVDFRLMDDAVTLADSTILTTTPPHGYGYGHYISYYGHYSYILLILMGITVLLGSLLVAYVKKIDSGIMRRSAERERGRCNHRGHSTGDSDRESDDLKKDLPPEYQIALEMPRPDIDDYTRFFEYTLVHSNDSLPRTQRDGQQENEHCWETEVPISSDNVLTVNELSNETLPSYEEYIQSMSEIGDA